MNQLGLIGFPIGHSKSPEIFNEFFENLSPQNNLWNYSLFPLEKIDHLYSLITSNPELVGLNITIPHKIDILPLLNYISSEALEIQSVNTLCIIPQENESAFFHYIHNEIGIKTIANQLTGSQSNNSSTTLLNKTLWGFNSDIFGFESTLKSLPNPAPKFAVILGDGGSAKTVKFALRKANIPFITCSRNPKNIHSISWDNLNSTLNQLPENTLFVNTTPLGMWPNTQQSPPLITEKIPANCFLIDLIYNPQQTQLMQKFGIQNLVALNGENMLQMQAIKSWEIFQAAGKFQK